jgi:hypothetical protein
LIFWLEIRDLVCELTGAKPALYFTAIPQDLKKVLEQFV